MSLETDLLVDRRVLRRKLSVWRVLAFLFLAIALVVAYLAIAGTSALQHRSPHIARIKLDGFVGDQTANLKLFDQIAQSQAQAVIVRINSPGGTTSGGEALYDGLRKLSASKPTVAFIDGLGASAAYMAAVGTDHIVARRSSLVGSIGVLVQYPNVSKLLDSIGVSVEAVKSSPLKAAPDGFTPTSPEARAALASVVNDTYGWFKNLVKDRRNFDDAGLAAVSDGRVFTGKQALDLKLVDEMGDEATAIAWLGKDKPGMKALPVEDWDKPSTTSSFPFARTGLAWLADSVGLASLGDAIRSAPETPPAALDGLVSVWHP
ncbi:signal peptide peptidase SppA [Labrys portucalensis]|uniref:Signal peptide peptidase SppA n=1 Tax=Labrys neptuniae TaxID=376174 RepID=A0ABV6ZKU0_9HYPH|nr:signal peptide peptidase SppA [Labrys neptuniae]MDT3379895.1 signal peptide peptidase SppA [Labrys neptuniae]